MTPYWPSLLGGMMIGLSVILLMALNGRVAGISGIVGSALRGAQVRTNVAFVAGLILGPVTYRVATGRFPEMTISASLPVIVIAGLLVGVGTRMGSGCTSGHGVVGIASLSPRSIVATLVFVGAGMAAVAALRGALA